MGRRGRVGGRSIWQKILRTEEPTQREDKDVAPTQEEVIKEFSEVVTNGMLELDSELDQLEMFKFVEYIIGHMMETKDGSLPEGTLETWFSLTERQQTILFLGMFGMIYGLIFGVE